MNLIARVHTVWIICAIDKPESALRDVETGTMVSTAPKAAFVISKEHGHATSLERASVGLDGLVWIAASIVLTAVSMSPVKRPECALLGASPVDLELCVKTSVATAWMRIVKRQMDIAGKAVLPVRMVRDVTNSVQVLASPAKPQLLALSVCLPSTVYQFVTNSAARSATQFSQDERVWNPLGRVSLAVSRVTGATNAASNAGFVWIELVPA